MPCGEKKTGGSRLSSSLGGEEDPISRRVKRKRLCADFRLVVGKKRKEGKKRRKDYSLSAKPRKGGRMSPRPPRLQGKGKRPAICRSQRLNRKKGEKEEDCLALIKT